VVGAVTLFDDDFKVDLKWSVPPLPCGVLLKKQSSQTASAEGLFLFELRRPERASLGILSAHTCGLPIFSL
jgi:hypothetical protein